VSEPRRLSDSPVELPVSSTPTRHHIHYALTTDNTSTQTTHSPRTTTTSPRTITRPLPHPSRNHNQAQTFGGKRAARCGSGALNLVVAGRESALGSGQVDRQLLVSVSCRTAGETVDHGETEGASEGDESG
jgi:hypothetical protein